MSGRRKERVATIIRLPITSRLLAPIKKPGINRAFADFDTPN